MQETFDKIAPGWYNFRHWSIFPQELKMMAERWPGGRLLNVGSAHGPDFLPFRDKFELYGVDLSPEMINMAKKYAAKFGFDVKLSVADARKLPFADAFFDHAIAVATYHHLLNQEDQLAALVELRRVLKPGGEAFITVWNRDQPRFWLSGRRRKVPWRTREEILERDYYLFSYGEIENLARKAGFGVIRSFPESRYRLPVKLFSRNICLLLSTE